MKKEIIKIRKSEFKTSKDLNNYSLELFFFSYFQKIQKSYKKYPFLIYLKKLNLSNNVISEIIKKSIISKSENIYCNNFKIIRRFHMDLSFLSSEIQMLLEQGYNFSALAKVREIIELSIFYQMMLKDNKIYTNSLEQGNFIWIELENFFNFKTNIETQEFIDYYKNKTTLIQRKKSFGWLEISGIKNFHMTNYVKKYWGEDKLVMKSWNLSHNFHHSSPAIFALSDKPLLYDPMSDLVTQLMLFTIFKFYLIIIKDSINFFEKQKEELFKIKLYKMKEIYEEIKILINDFLILEKDFWNYIKKIKN